MKSLDILNTSKTEMKIRLLLTARDMTQAELAKALNLSRSSLSQRLTGRTQFKADEIVQIASVLGVSTDFLLSEVE